MSNFWANHLAPAAPAPAPVAPAPAPAAPAAWWMPQTVPAAVPAPNLEQQAMAAVAAQSLPPGQAHIGDLLAQQEYTTTKAQSAKDTETCPDCGGPNYVRSPQQPNSMKSCFDCGYNPRFLHSTHGTSGIGQSNLPTSAARVQINTPPAGFGAMNSIVGKI